MPRSQKQKRKDPCIMSSSMYTATGSGARYCVRSPGQHDVLSGRGGMVNAHPGNKTYRSYVAERKVDYTTSLNKDDKTRICREVISMVTRKGGRFLVKESTKTNSMWVELPESRVLSKTGQALREGAPSIRATHGVQQPTRLALPGNRVTKRIGDSDRPPKPNSKRVRVAYAGKLVRPDEASPALAPVIAPSLADETLSPLVQPAVAPLVDEEASFKLPPDIPPPRPLTDYTTKLPRNNSLAFSDLSNEDLPHFVNPFEDEFDWIGSSNSSSISLSSPRVGVVRDTSGTHAASKSKRNSLDSLPSVGLYGKLTERYANDLLFSDDTSVGSSSLPFALSEWPSFLVQ